jgi:transposase
MPLNNWPEFKADIVECCCRDRTIAQVARDFDLTETARREWVKQADVDAGEHEFTSELVHGPRLSVHQPRLQRSCRANGVVLSVAASVTARTTRSSVVLGHDQMRADRHPRLAPPAPASEQRSSTTSRAGTTPVASTARSASSAPPTAKQPSTTTPTVTRQDQTTKSPAKRAKPTGSRWDRRALRRRRRQGTPALLHSPGVSRAWQI